MGECCYCWEYLPAAELKMEKPHLLDCNIKANLLDLSFDIDLSPLSAAPATCEYTCIDGDVMIISLLNLLSFPDLKYNWIHHDRCQ